MFLPNWTRPTLLASSDATGKTGVLVARIAHLVADRSVSPGRILALAGVHTFFMIWTS